jgi:hypothetical protein
MHFGLIFWEYVVRTIGIHQKKWQYNIISIQNYIKIFKLMVTVKQLNVK